MKTIITLAVAAAFAVPAYAQTQQNLPNSQDRAQNREAVRDKVDTAKDKLPSAEERAGNRREVSKSAAGTALTTKVKSALAGRRRHAHHDQHQRRQRRRRGDVEGQGRLRRREEEGRGDRQEGRRREVA